MKTALTLLLVTIGICAAVRPPPSSSLRIRTLRSKKLGVGSLDPLQKVQAESYNYQTGVALQDCADTDGGLEVYDIGQGDVIGYFDADFNSGNATRIEFRVVAEFPVGHAVEVDVRLDNDTGTSIATLVVTDTGGVWVTLDTDLKVAPPSSVHDLYLTFKISDAEYDYWAINWFQFFQQ